LGWVRRQYDRGKALWRRALEENASPKKFAQAVALGAFINAAPLYGIRKPIAALVAWKLELNKLTAMLSTHILLGPLGTLSILLEVHLGCWILRRPMIALPDTFSELLTQARAALLPWAVGALVVAPPFALLCGLAAYPIAKRYHARKARRLALANVSGTLEK
jgi:uncharacterized protein (DUF2062 family)